ncbi:hypothetical protein BBK36DRAFT_1166691 [Trichoderma citrinoviride]|uniref:Uncharacterized protein n=1 Tax=Trichoderma citrinoviride TaxID=58853 RepID=A0A2T4BHL2_9HYPO|nr:hypothetical protein BBK36DRAFT_1166691 [Trichoderma citrinoviride]PTB68805.1 hypothetical protein BBK36DRAFT_1166691 [Trichoderma citrinoviride]
MALLKRKRSAAALSSGPDCSSSMMALDAPALLHSRTLKRYRDNRPSDEEVHQHTLGLLYSAQQRQQQDHQHHHQHGVAAVPADQMLLPEGSSSSDPSPLPTPTSSASASAHQHDGQQQSLHRFWNIGSQPSSGTSSPGLADPSRALATPTACDDCGAPLAGSDGGVGGGDDMGMDLDGGAAQDTACGACGKHVCFSCSVSNLGEEKRCLQCAGRRVWIGGIGWTNAGVPVC